MNNFINHYSLIIFIPILVVILLFIIFKITKNKFLSLFLFSLSIFVIFIIINSLTPKELDQKSQMSSKGGLEALSNEDMVSYLVNKGLDGDMSPINDCASKVLRGKAKAMMVKIKRGQVEKPPMPEIPAAGAPVAAAGCFCCK